MDLAVWSSWGTFGGAIVAAAATYSFTLLVVRIAGRRTVSQMSAYDVVVTIAIGSIAASTALPRDPALLDGAAVLMTFLTMQTAVGVLRQRAPSFERWVNFTPHAVVINGEPQLPSSPWTAQLTLSDVESSLRLNGIGELAHARLAVLEPNGKLTVTTEPVPPALFTKVQR